MEIAVGLLRVKGRIELAYLNFLGSNLHTKDRLLLTLDSVM